MEALNLRDLRDLRGKELAAKILERIQVPQVLPGPDGQVCLYWTKDVYALIDDKIHLSTENDYTTDNLDQAIKEMKSFSTFWAYTDCADLHPQPWFHLIQIFERFYPDLVPVVNAMKEDDVLYLGEATLNRDCCGGMISKRLLSQQEAMDLYKVLEATPSNLAYGAVLNTMN